ncbi:MAG: IS110 family transposase [Kiritimatiellae bacterium]|nr:IS110 family transposase [Kiritimatiellia bacterium]
MSLQERKLLMAMELSNTNWKLCFGDGSTHRERTIPARAVETLLKEVQRAKEKFALPAEAPVVSCYEAGRDGFWVDRMLTEHGITNYIMDPSSIEVPRQARQRKTDRLDSRKLLKLLVRYELWGERDSFAKVQVPNEEQEAQLRTHRERERLTKERTAHRARIKSLCVLHGVDASKALRVEVSALRDWKARELPTPWLNELRRERNRLKLVDEQLAAVEETQKEALASPQSKAVGQARKLQQLKSIGVQSSWVLCHECFGWREFANRKRLGSFSGLTGTPFDSGDTLREQGISKAGNRRVRTTMIELAWLWLRWQPDSALTHWYLERYAGTKRSRRKGIVALARKLLIALWKYLEQDIVPEGAILKAA